MTDMKNRIFVIQDDVNDETIGKINFNLLSLIEDDNKLDEKEKNYKREPIKIYINSNGGSVFDMWSLIEIIENSKTPIYTYVTGYAFSAAFKIFIAGHKRFIGKRATLMYHQMSGCGNRGKYQDMIEEKEVLDKIMTNIENYVVEKTKMDLDFIQKIRKEKKDYYIFGEEAIKLGCADYLMEGGNDEKDI